MDMVMGCQAFAVAVAAFGYLHRNNVKVGVPYTPLCGQFVGQRAHGCNSAFKNGNLHAAIVIQVHMQARHTQVMVIVRGASQPLRQGACFMIIDVAERCDAGRFIRQGGLARSRVTHHVAHCF